LLVFPVLALAVAAAGCGGTNPPGIADVAGAPTTTSSSSQSPSPGGLSSGSGGGAQLTMKMTNGVKFSQCMRSHGVPNFPDPGSSGSIQIGPSSGIDPGSPKFQAAQSACQKLMPHGGMPTPEQVQKMQRAALAFSRCMRAHGLANFPDPDFSGGHISMRINANGKNGLDPNTPTFRHAQQACQGQFPKLGGAGTARTK
jgi:hypothetical protein